MLFSNLPTLQIYIPFIGRIAFVSKSSDIKEIGLNNKFARLATTKCPMTAARNFILQKADTFLPLIYKNEYHSGLYDNDDPRYLKTEVIEDLLQKRVSNKELIDIKKLIDKQDIENLKEFILYTVFSRLVRHKDIKSFVSMIIENIDNRNKLNEIAETISDYTPVPKVELLFIMKLLYNTVADYIYNSYTQKKRFTLMPVLPIIVRICTEDCTVNDTLYKKDSYVLLLIGFSSKEKDNYKFTFGTGTNFRHCRFRDFFVDLMDRLVEL